jgi:hypothetical protein
VAQGGADVTGYRWDLVLVNVVSFIMLGVDWYCFQIMRRWGREPEEPRWVYYNATTADEEVEG